MFFFFSSHRCTPVFSFLWKSIACHGSRVYWSLYLFPLGPKYESEKFNLLKAFSGVQITFLSACLVLAACLSASDIYYKVSPIGDISFPRTNAAVHAPKEVTWETMSPVEGICCPRDEHKLTKAYRSGWLMSHLDLSLSTVVSTSTV